MAIGSLFAFMVVSEVDDDIQDPANDFNNDAKNLSATFVASYPSWIDNGFLMAFVLLIIGVVVSVFLIDAHPIFFFVNIVIGVFVFVVAAILANTYDDVASDPSMAVYAASFPFTTWIITHYLELSIAVFFIVLIALLLKLK